LKAIIAWLPEITCQTLKLLLNVTVTLFGSWVRQSPLAGHGSSGLQPVQQGRDAAGADQDVRIHQNERVGRGMGDSQVHAAGITEVRPGIDPLDGEAFEEGAAFGVAAVVHQQPLGFDTSKIGLQSLHRLRR